MAKTYFPTTSAKRTIDASGKSLGRVATEIATTLRGKDTPAFAPNKITGAIVTVVNADKIRYSGRKLQQKMYHKHTGYIGNLKSIGLEKLLEKDSTEPLRRAVYGMLPPNRLRKELMKRLTIFAGEGKE